MKYSFIIIIFISSSLHLFAQDNFGEQLDIFLPDSLYFENPSHTQTVDFDNDGDIDVLATTNTQIAWFENDGTGNFIHKHKITLSLSGAGAAHAADIDNDGDWDIICAETNRILWFENDGIGNFPNEQTIATGSYQVNYILGNDMDNDGTIDVLIGDSYKLVWYKNLGSGNFGTNEQIINLNSSIDFLKVVDINADGLDDIYAGDNLGSSSSISWYQGDGSGNFTGPTFIDSDFYFLRATQTGDIDNDGDEDVLLSLDNAYDNGPDEGIMWYENNGNGNFGLRTTLREDYTDYYTSLETADLDNDGDLEIIASNRYRTTRLKNNNGVFDSVNNIISLNGYIYKRHISIGDINGDGDLDVINYSENDREIMWSANNGNGNFVNNSLSSISKYPTQGNTISTCAADMDNDGDEDILLLTENFSGPAISGDSDYREILWVENLNNGNFAPPQIVYSSPYTHHFKSISATDFNGDGHIDILISGSQIWWGYDSYYSIKDEIIWLENDGNQNFTNEHNVSSNRFGIDKSATADMDNDGDMDIISRATLSNTTDWYENDGSGNFSIQHNITILYSGIFNYADMDNDGDIDIITTKNWFENNGNGVFYYSHPINIGNVSPIEIVAVDMDNDGDKDVLYNTTTFISWYENDGAGNFLYQNIFYYTPYQIHMGEILPIDMDEDGDWDIVVEHSGQNNGTSDYLSLFENDGTGSFSNPPQITLENLVNIDEILAVDIDGDNHMDIVYDHWGAHWHKNLYSKDIFVDINAQGNNDGTSWADAFTDLQDALLLDNYDVHVAEGTYLPTQGTSRGSSFHIPEGTTLLGGYPTGGGNRNPLSFETILSGNVDNDVSITGDSYHVVSIKNVDNVTIDGVSIRDGNANDSNSYARSRGGGIYINNATVTFNQVDLKWNRAIYGAALFSKFSQNITITNSTIKKNKAEFGAALYYSNSTMMYIDHSQIINNTATNRCAIESNNATYTRIENSLIANNISANANAIGYIATNRDQSSDIINCTILGETKNKNLITVQIGNNDQLDLNIDNSIIAHQNLNFDKNIKAYNNGTFNFNHNNCYFQGAAVIGNGTNTLLSDIDGDLMLNSDYSVNECSPVVDAGNDALALGTIDLLGNNRFSGTVDIGAFEAQNTCLNPREIESDKISFLVYPNPVTTSFHIKTDFPNIDQKVIIYDMLSRKIFEQSMGSDLEIDTQNWASGIYSIIIHNKKGEVLASQKLSKTN